MKRWVVGASLGLVVGACHHKPDEQHQPDGNMSGPMGVVQLQARAFNGGAAATMLRLAPSSGVPRVPSLALAAAAPHTIDPSTYRVHAFMSAPPTELKIRILMIRAESPTGAVLLFGDPNGAGPGAEISLTNGTIDLATAGLALNPIPVGHYTGLSITVSRALKMKGCVSGNFNTQPALSGMYNGVTYTNDALSAGAHTFCTIAAKSLLNVYNGTDQPDSPVGTDAEYEAQTTPEEVEIDMGGGSQVNGTYPSSASDVRNASGGFGARSEFDVTEANPVQLTLVVDMNRMLRFYPNIARNGSAQVQPLGPGYPPGTSYFYTSDFNFSVALFTGQPGSVEGYQLTSEVCQDINCVPGDPPDALSREWMTLIRDANGQIAGGMVSPDDAPGAAFGDVIPPMTTATDGIVHISVGMYRVTIIENGYIDGFVFKNVGDPEDSGTITPVHGNGPVDGHGPFPLWYTRKL